jgi:lysophospholipase L1-like esterase
MRKTIAVRGPQVEKRRLVVWSITAISLLIASCSGGGGGTSTPVAAPDIYVYPSTQPLTVSAPGVLKNDTGTSLTAVLVDAPQAGTLTLNSNGSFTYTSNDGTSSDTFSYKATNANGSSNITTVSLAPNQPPAAVNACLSIPAGTSLNGTLTATDEPSSQPDVFGPVPNDPSPVGPYKGQAQINQNGTFTYTPANSNFVGMDKFNFQVTDKFGATSTGTATIFINGAVRIMPLGDSITEGVWFADTTSSCNDPTFNNCPDPSLRVSYRRTLYNALEALSPNYAVNMVGSLSNGAGAGLTQPHHEGHAGFSSNQIAVNVPSYLSSNPPDIILLHIGTNNFTTDATDVKTLLDNISTWAQGFYGVLPTGQHAVTVYVAKIIQAVNSITPTDVTTFNTNVKNIAGDRTDVKVIMVDQQTMAGLTYTITNDPSCFVEGGTCTVGDMASDLHPNPSGYTKMANKWFADIQASRVLPTCQ